MAKKKKKEQFKKEQTLEQRRKVFRETTIGEAIILGSLTLYGMFMIMAILDTYPKANILTAVQYLVPAMMEKFAYKSVMQVPKIEKVVINMGMGDVKDNPKALESALAELTEISGQKPVVTIARKSVANFKVREGMKVGAKVTIRGDRMYEFVDKLINIVIPRIRDFRGVSANSFDGRGNYALGLREQLVFPEIDFDKVDKIRGMDIIIVTTAHTDEEARELLTFMGMPFIK